MVIGIQDVYIPSGWDLKPLGECVKEKLSYGINAPAIPYDGKHPAYIRITDITEDGRYDDSDRKAVPTQELERYTLCEGDIVLARTGASTGKSYLYDKKDGQLVYAGFLIKASVNCEANNPHFIVGQLRTPRYWAWVAATSMRSGQPGINGKEYSSFLIPVAPKKEQDAIAEALSTFDDHIANLTELIEKKKAIRDGALEDLVSGRTRIDGFRTLPTRTVPVGTIRKVERGTRLVRSQLSKFGGYPVYQNSLEPLGYYHKTNCDANSVYIIAAGSAAEMGFSNMAFWAADDCYFFGQSPEIDQKFLYYALLRKQEYLRVQSRRTSIPRLSRDVIDGLDIYLPHIKEQEAIADALTAMDDEIKSFEDERDKMIQIREGAMDDLLTGRVRLAI